MGNLTMQVEAQYADRVSVLKGTVNSYQTKFNEQDWLVNLMSSNRATMSGVLSTFSWSCVKSTKVLNSDYAQYLPQNIEVSAQVDWYEQLLFSHAALLTKVFNLESCRDWAKRVISAYDSIIPAAVAERDSLANNLNTLKGELNTLVAEYNKALAKAESEERATVTNTAEAVVMTDPTLAQIRIDAEVEQAKIKAEALAAAEKANQNKTIIFGAIAILILSIGAFVVIKS